MKIISVTLSRVFTITLLSVSTLAYGQLPSRAHIQSPSLASVHAATLQEIIDHGNVGTISHEQVLEIEGILEGFIQDESVTAEDVRMIAELSRTKGAASNNTFDLAKDFIRIFTVYVNMATTEFRDVETLVKSLPKDYIYPNPTLNFRFHATFSAEGVQINSRDLAEAIRLKFPEMELAEINREIIRLNSNITVEGQAIIKNKNDRKDQKESKLEIKVEEQPKGTRR